MPSGWDGSGRVPGGLGLAVAVTAARALAQALGATPTVIAPEPERARPILSGLEQAPVDGYRGTRADALADRVTGSDIVVVPARVAHGPLGGVARGLGGLQGRPTLVVAAAPCDDPEAWDAPGVRAIAGVR